jgi:hypothetical protein
VVNNKVRPSSRTSEADWIADRVVDFGYCVTAIVPQGFDAYVRIFHPATSRNGMNGKPIRWSEVAAMSGRTMHRLAQFHAINRPEVTDVDEAGNGPRNGNLPPDLLKAVCAAVSAHTETPDSCFFCLWEGYGWLRDTGSSGRIVFTPIGYTGPPEPPFGYTDAVPEFIRAAVSAEPRVYLPGRDYLFFEGPLEGAVEFGEYLTPEHFLPQSPNLFWPEDRAWCVGSEIDLYCTLVGGSDALAEQLLADPQLEAWRVFPDDPITSDSDHINR